MFLGLVYTYLLLGASLAALCTPRLSHEPLPRAVAAGLFIVLAWPVLVWETLNMRERVACAVISLGISLLPESYRNKRFIENMMRTGHIKVEGKND